MIYPNVVERSRAGVRRRRRPPFASGQRVALVTGSADGLGGAIARRLAGDGFAVALNDADEDKALEVVGAIHRGGGVARAFRGNVADERQAARLAQAVASSLGFIDVLVLNATGPQPEEPLHDVAWVLRRALLPGMEAKGWGRIVKVDPEVVEAPRRALAGNWARELAPLGITVNTVAPRFAAPHEDVAHAVSFVASADAGFVTGQRIVVDGGRGPVG
jgi:3-oxoacyl-[acyl-carrier protein] reductase